MAISGTLLHFIVIWLPPLYKEVVIAINPDYKDVRLKDWMCFFQFVITNQCRVTLYRNMHRSHVIFLNISNQVEALTIWCVVLQGQVLLGKVECALWTYSAPDMWSAEILQLLHALIEHAKQCPDFELACPVPFCRELNARLVLVYSTLWKA